MMRLAFVIKQLDKNVICIYICSNNVMQTQSKHISHASLAQLAGGSYLVYNQI